MVILELIRNCKKRNVCWKFLVWSVIGSWWCKLGGGNEGSGSSSSGVCARIVRACRAPKFPSHIGCWPHFSSRSLYPLCLISGSACRVHLMLYACLCLFLLYFSLLLGSGWIKNYKFKSLSSNLCWTMPAASREEAAESSSGKTRIRNLSGRKDLDSTSNRKRGAMVRVVGCCLCQLGDCNLVLTLLGPLIKQVLVSFPCPCFWKFSWCILATGYSYSF